ncbi:MAG: hypothetical protein IJV23_02845 [Prevotella sp.]|nr:hypothetical protein [Prevotella sp.]
MERKFTQKDTNDSWYTTFAANIRSAGIVICVLTNHRPTVSATTINKSRNDEKAVILRQNH